MNLSKFWKNLTYWQKGAVAGLIIGLIYLILIWMILIGYYSGIGVYPFTFLFSFINYITCGLYRWVFIPQEFCNHFLNVLEMRVVSVITLLFCVILGIAIAKIIRRK